MSRKLVMQLLFLAFGVMFAAKSVYGDVEKALEVAGVLKARIAGSLKPHVQVLGKACPDCESIVRLPKGSMPLTFATGATEDEFFVASVAGFTIYHVTLSSGRVYKVYQTSDRAIPFDGIAYDPEHSNIWTTGSSTGKAVVLQLSRSSNGTYTVSNVRSFNVASGKGALITGVQVHKGVVYFSNAYQPLMHTVPSKLPRNASKPIHAKAIKLLGDYPLTCKQPCMPPFDESLNGIAVVNSSLVLFTHSRRGSILRAIVNHKAGTAELLELPLPGTINGKPLTWADELIYIGSNTGFVADAFTNRVLRLKFNKNFSSAEVTCAFEMPTYKVPCSVQWAGGKVWAANSNLLGCPLPFCPETSYELIGASPKDFCQN